MVRSPLLNVLLSPDRSPRQATQVAEQVVRSALNDLEQIAQLGNCLASDDPQQFDRASVSLLFSMYSDWVAEAELLLGRVRHIEQMSGAVPGADDLQDAIGRTLARLSISVDDLEQSLKEIAQGRTVTAAEVRRELRLRVQ